MLDLPHRHLAYHICCSLGEPQVCLELTSCQTHDSVTVKTSGIRDICISNNPTCCVFYSVRVIVEAVPKMNIKLYKGLKNKT